MKPAYHTSNLNVPSIFFSTTPSNINLCGTPKNSNEQTSFVGCNFYLMDKNIYITHTTRMGGKLQNEK